MLAQFYSIWVEFQDQVILIKISYDEKCPFSLTCFIDKVRKEGKEAYSSLCCKHRTATGTHLTYGITQCYLPPGRGDITE